MGNAVRERFGHLFRPKPPIATPGPTEDEIAQEREHQAQKTQDMRVFVSTMAYKEFRENVENAIESITPDPREGIEAAACSTFKQEGLREALRIVDRMVQMAEERVSDE